MPKMLTAPRRLTRPAAPLSDHLKAWILLLPLSLTLALQVMLGLLSLVLLSGCALPKSQKPVVTVVNRGCEVFKKFGPITSRDTPDRAREVRGHNAAYRVYCE